MTEVRVSASMVEAGLRAWDAAHKAGIRQWPEMLERVYAAMHAARPRKNEGRHTLPAAAPDKPPRDHWARKVLP